MIRQIFMFLLGLGPVGLILLGILDSSILFLPLGNDLLVTILAARNGRWLPVYATCAAFGSTLGVVITHLLAKKGGEAGLKRLMSEHRYETLHQKMKDHAGIPIAVAALAPPPFPFTPFVAAASAFRYPRNRLLLIVFVARVARFALVGLLAIYFGSAIMQFTKTDTFFRIMLGIVIVSILGSVFSVIRWFRK